MVESVLSEFMKSDDLSLQEILNNLLDGETNLDLKTHINRPKQLASLFILGNHLKVLGYKKSHKIVMDFIDIYLRYMVSFNRLSRIEITKALSHLLDDEKKTKGNTLTTNLK